jgi:hypothetical protein
MFSCFMIWYVGLAGCPAYEVKQPVDQIRFGRDSQSTDTDRGNNARGAVSCLALCSVPSPFFPLPKIKKEIGRDFFRCSASQIERGNAICNLVNVK